MIRMIAVIPQSREPTTKDKIVRLLFVQIVCPNDEPFKESTPTLVAALLVVAVALAGDGIVVSLVLVVIGALVVFTRYINCGYIEFVMPVKYLVTVSV